MSNYAIVCTNLCKYYGMTKAIDTLNLEIPTGKTVGIAAGQGNGKTTLLKLASGLLTPGSGKILINDEAPGTESRKEISYLPDRNCFNSHMNIKAIIKMYAGFCENFDSEKAQNSVTQLGISLKTKFIKLSEENQKKVSLIFVMCRKADIYILDEPFGADEKLNEFITGFITQNRQKSSTVIIASEFVEPLENIIDDIIFIKKGRLVLHEEVCSLKEREEKTIAELYGEVFEC